MKTKKSLGQHWLRDETALQAMVNSGQVKEGDRVLEVGPGLGTLTVKLLDAGAKIVAVEYDEELFAALKRQNISELDLVHDDILRFDLGYMGPDYKVVANIPYYLTGKLLRRLFETQNPPVLTSLLVQKEVAERLAARPGKMSILSVVAQHYCEVELGQIVKAELFEPPPKVDSQIVTLRRRDTLPAVNERKFMLIVKAGFSARRKKLINSLSGGLKLNKETIENALYIIGHKPTVRAQELSIADWYALEKELSSLVA